MTQRIYTITSVHRSDKFEHDRSWTWFPTLEDSQKNVEVFGNFYYEHFYNYLVIEEIPQGSVMSKYQEWWYGWDNGWKPIEKPIKDRHIAMG